MKKTILALTVFATQIFYSQVEKKFNLGLGLSTDAAINNKSMRFGPALKLDYNITPKLGVGFRGMGVFGAWDLDYEYSDLSYKHKIDYTKGKDFAFGVDAIYHVVGNNQNSEKFGLRLEGGLGYQIWSQNITRTDEAPVTDSSYFSYENTLGENNLVLKLGLGAEYKIGPGKLFLDIPLYTPIYGTNYSRYTNQKTGPGFSGFTDSSFNGSEFFTDFTLFLNLGYQISF